MFTITIKELAARKVRLLSTVFAVLLAVSLMAGTLVFTDTLTASYDDALTDAHAGVDAMVRSPSEVARSPGKPGTKIDISVLDNVLAVDGVEAAAARVSGYAQVVGRNGTAVGDQEDAPAVGTNWIDDADLNPYRVVDGQAPRAGGEVVIDRASATEGDIDVGDTVTVLSQLVPAPFRVSGIVTFGSADSAAGATSVLFSDEVAQQYLSSPGQIDGVVVRAADDIATDVVIERLSRATPGLEVVSGDELVAEDQAAIQDTFGPFRIFLLVFAFVAVFVGAFMINNTFSIIVAQRTQHLAMLRALGASRRQVLRSVMTEAVAIGVIGSAAGLAAGIGLAFALKWMFAGIGIELPEGPMVISTGSMLFAAAIGVAVVTLSAWLPARRAGRIAPIAALRDVAIDRTSSSRRRPVIGTIVTGSGVAMLLAGLGGERIQLVGLGAVLALVGVAVLGPVLARPVVAVFGIIVGRRGISGDMAIRNARRNPKRTARTASSLMIGVALVAFIAVFASSVKASLGGSLDDTFIGSHIVDSGAWEGVGGFSPALADQMERDPTVDVVSESRVSTSLVDGSEYTLEGVTAATIGSIFDLGDVEGDLTDLGPDGLAVDGPTAVERGWTLGTVVPVTFAGVEHPFVVRATYSNAAEWVGKQFVDISAFDTHLPAQLDYRIYAIGDDEAIRTAAAAYPSTTVMDADQFLDDVTDDLDLVLGVIYALLALAVLIALLGIANTLALSIHERTRELGLLRAVGMLRSQVRSSIRWESIMIALFGTTLGLAVGSFFGWATVRALNEEGIDQFTYPVSSIGVIVAVACLAGAAAAIVPARRAARLDVLTALTAE
jgi:putative ABC transport system permease protein